MKHLKVIIEKFAVSIALISLTAQLIIPVNTSHAQSEALIGVAYGAFECKFSDTLESAFDTVASKLGGLIEQGLGAIGLGFLGNLFGGGVPSSTTGAVPTEVLLDIPLKDREQKDCFSAAVKREFIKATVKDVLEFVRSDDKTRFIQNYGDEILHAVDGAVAEVAEEALGANICSPFRNHFEVIVERSLYPDRSLRAPRFSCTISEALETQGEALRRFSNDFRNGSWNRWVELHRGSNNELGFYLAVNEQAILKKAQAEEAIKLETQVGQGINNETHCVEATLTYGGGETERLSLASGIKDIDWGLWVSDQIQGDSSLEKITCSKEEVITPASVIASQVNKAVSAETDNLLEADSFYEIMKEIMSIAVSDILKNGL